MNKSTLPLIVMLVILGQLGIDLYLPSLPAMAVAFDVDTNSIQFSLSVFLLAMAISQLFYGALSDAWGRRRVILPAILLHLTGSYICYLASDFTVLIIGRILEGFAAGACVVIARAVARDCYDGKQLASVSAYLSIAWALVPMIAPVVGGYIQEWFNWQTNFLLLMIIAIVCFSAIYLFLSETRKGDAKAFNFNEMFASIRLMLKNRQYLGYMLVPALFFGHSVAYMTASPMLFQITLGQSPSQYGHVIMATAAIYLLGNILNRFLLKTYSIVFLVKVGIALAIFGAFLMLLFAVMGILSLWAVVLPIFVTYFAAGIVFANCVTLALIPYPERAGMASALLGFSQILSGFIGSALMSVFSELTQMPLAVYLVCTLVLAFVSVRFIVPAINPSQN